MYQGSESRRHLGSPPRTCLSNSQASAFPVSAAAHFLFPRQWESVSNPLTAYKWKYQPLTHSPHPHHRPHLLPYFSRYHHLCLGRIKRRSLRLQFESGNRLETGSRNMNTTMKPRAGSAVSPDHRCSMVLTARAAQVPPAPVHIRTHAHAHICILAIEYTPDSLFTPQNDVTI